MAELSKIEPQDFEELYAKYLRDDDPRISRESWQALFQTICQSHPDPEFGYKLTEDGKIVGMLGMLSSIRFIDDQQIPFCNLHSWFVDEEHRGSSLLLMRPILRMKDHVITDLTPTAPVIKISLKLGFQLINTPQMILRSRAKPSPDSTRCTLQWNDDVDLNRLDRSESQIFRDHSTQPFHRLLITTKSQHCLLILRRIDMHWRPYASVLYASAPDILITTQQSWQNEIRSRLNVKRIVGDQTFLSDKLLGVRKFPFCQTNRLFRSDHFSADQVDTLYSEVSQLGLTTLPGLRAICSASFNPMRIFSKRETRRETY